MIKSRNVIGKKIKLNRSRNITTDEKWHGYFENRVTDIILEHDWSKIMEKPVKIEQEINSGLAPFDLVLSWEDEKVPGGVDYEIIEINGSIHFHRLQKLPLDKHVLRQRMLSNERLPFNSLDYFDLKEQLTRRHTVDEDKVISTVTDILLKAKKRRQWPDG